jgi:hypothetical protein
MPSLSSNEVHGLGLRGINVETDIYGSHYTFTTQGLYWLFNVLHEQPVAKRSKKLTVSLLKTIAKAAPNDHWRELRIKAVELPTDGSNYYQLAIYLNGTPPRSPLTVGPLAVLSGPIPFLLEGRFLALPDYADANLLLTEEEQGELLAGGFLKARFGASAIS